MKYVTPHLKTMPNWKAARRTCWPDEVVLNTQQQWQRVRHTTKKIACNTHFDTSVSATVSVLHTVLVDIFHFHLWYK